MTKILLVDDTIFIKLRMRSLLEKETYHVFDADNGTDALESYSKNQPDLILLDITMPGISGMDVLKKIRETDTSTKIIMLSATSESALIQEAHELGGNGFLVKPVDDDKILSEIKKVLAG